VTWRRIILGSIGLLLLLLIVSIGLVNWLVRTEGGTRWLLTTLEQRAGNTISIQAIEGSLSSGVIAIGIRVETDAFELDIDRVRAVIR
jgi:autotransporter translocation and assembly factor TamB